MPFLPFSFVLVALTVPSSSRHCWEIGLGCGQPGQLGISEVVHTYGCLVFMLPAQLRDEGLCA